MGLRSASDARRGGNGIAVNLKSGHIVDIEPCDCRWSKIVFSDRHVGHRLSFKTTTITASTRRMHGNRNGVSVRGRIEKAVVTDDQVTCKGTFHPRSPGLELNVETVPDILKRVVFN